jgi:hypothetical protein
MALRNPWVGYLDRTYEQIKANVLTIFQSNVPEITDHTESNPFVKGINIWSGISEMISYYLDRKAREVFLGNAQKFSSAVKTANLFDYRIKGVLAADVDLKFYIDNPAPSNIIIPAETQVATREGITFRTLTTGMITTGNQEVFIPARQWEKVSNVALGNSSGIKSQVFALEEGVVDGNIDVVVNNVTYTPAETFGYVFKDDQVYRSSLNEAGEMAVEFGDNINGKIPPSGSPIVVSYYISSGSGGNVGVGSIVDVRSSLTVPSGVVIKVTNQLAASGGSDAENLKDLQKRIPLSIRTKDRAISKQDYIDIVKIFPGVAQSGILFDCTSIKVFISPNGGGVASSTLLTNVRTYLQDKVSIREMDVIEVLSAGQVIVQYVINVKVRSDYARNAVRTSVVNNIDAFHDVENQEIGGGVALSDIYEVVESTPGVVSSEVIQMTPVPYARPINHSRVLNWARQILPASQATQKWTITIISATTFEVIKGTAFMGQFTIGNQVIFPEVVFTVVDDVYVVGDSWEFFSYKYSGSIVLEEQSIPATGAEYITINVSGGYI